MKTIKFNNVEFNLDSYSRSTSFMTDTIISTGYCALSNVDNMSDLKSVAQEDITSLQIYCDENLIYSLEDINLHIDSINEYLQEDKMIVNLNLTFNI